MNAIEKRSFYFVIYKKEKNALVPIKVIELDDQLTLTKERRQ